MEYPVVKLRYEDIPSADFSQVNPAIYEITQDGIVFPILIHYKPEKNRAVVFGTGDVSAAKIKPCFSRNSWSGRIDATCIYYSDPTLALSNSEGLLWGYGRNDNWYLERLSALIQEILGKMQILLQKTLFFGSSGGGFTAICLALLGGGDMPPSSIPNWMSGTGIRIR